MKLLVATANLHKVGEIQQILQHYPIELLDLRSFRDLPPPEETGVTYLENALLKARYYGRNTGLLSLSDDSGLEVDALDGAPGLHSARFGGSQMPHTEKVQLLLQHLGKIEAAPRTARFRCCSAIFDPQNGQTWSFEATCEGTIAPDARGDQGFGYDPIFLVHGKDRTMAEFSAEEKHAVSHRGQSLRGLLDDYLKTCEQSCG